MVTWIRIFRIIRIIRIKILETSEKRFLPSPIIFVGDPIIKILRNIKVLLIGFPTGARGNTKSVGFSEVYNYKLQITLN